MVEKAGIRIHISGVVQGVGFRPFVYTLATRLSLTGWVRNTSAGVDIELDGPSTALQAFVEGLRRESPPLSHIDELIVEDRPTDGYEKFEILHSQPIPDAFQPISPDISICPDCLRELFDPNDRRYRYPFINCTNCGPRFTIIEDIPYDRPNTTMAGFKLCSECAAEYNNPLDRRFHAQPVACPDCGPEIWIEPSGKPLETPNLKGDAAIWATQRLLAQGKIIAIKGLGGFHLACDATNPTAVAELRHRKLRVDKPFALMMPDVETVQLHCFVNEAERALLESRERPIVILQRRPESNIAVQVAPQQDSLGVMLPYTPLHYLLLYEGDHPARAGSTVAPVLVMTSGNLSEEPIATENDEARERLGALADAFMLHNREIRTRCDDSVMRIFGAGAKADDSLLMPLRRSRGYAPFPVRLPWEVLPLLAAGAELKNTFCITRGRYAFISHHIGDLENYETLESFQDGVEHFERLFRIHPEALVYDLHPNYLATRYAQARAERDKLPAIGVQHHHAHIAACMVEHGLTGDQPVIGVAFDGTGYGDDGAIWGGEFLVANYQGYRRVAHLAYVPLPGGDAAVRKPARTALAHLWHAGLDWDPELPSPAYLCVEERTALRSQLEKNINTPFTSSMGRLFDAAAALAGVRQKVNYEAQAAIEFEALVDPVEDGAYDFELFRDDQHPEGGLAPLQIDSAPLIASLCTDQLAGVSIPTLAARFHNGVAHMVLEVCRQIRNETNLNTVVLSGGGWQNMILLTKTIAELEKDGFKILIHRQVPSNDGGLALGQAVIAAKYFSQSGID